MVSILITGSAGFIASHLCEKLLAETDATLIGIDNYNDYYNPSIKESNSALSRASDRFKEYRVNIEDAAAVNEIFEREKPDHVFHFAARAGVRPSIVDPAIYVSTNVAGTLNILEASRKVGVKKIVAASTSSIYGNHPEVPFSESMMVDRPISPYAASKKGAEMLCHTYHHLYGLPIACIRFFTVYGPRQRPDMAIHKFTKAILNGDPIQLFNNGNCERDYTYVDDIVHGVLQVYQHDFSYDIVNLGESQVISTLDLVTKLEELLGKKATMTLVPAQPGDVDRTFADISRAREVYGYNPGYPVDKGLAAFVAWYQQHHS